jgi:serine/threonine protein kinase
MEISFDYIEISYKGLREKERKQVAAEVKILKSLKSPYIVKYYEE